MDPQERRARMSAVNLDLNPIVGRNAIETFSNLKEIYGKSKSYEDVTNRITCVSFLSLTDDRTFHRNLSVEGFDLSGRLLGDEYQSIQSGIFILRD